MILNFQLSGSFTIANVFADPVGVPDSGCRLYITKPPGRIRPISTDLLKTPWFMMGIISDSSHSSISHSSGEFLCGENFTIFGVFLIQFLLYNIYWVFKFDFFSSAVQNSKSFKTYSLQNSYRTILSAIWQIFYEFPIFCNWLHKAAML